MHWFWRAAVAVIVGSVAEFFLFAFLDAFKPQNQAESQGGLLLLFIPPMLTFRIDAEPPARKSSAEKETRCRKCGDILRGISEPRCPGCDERI